MQSVSIEVDLGPIKIFEDALQWALRVRRARAEPPFDAAVRELSRFPEHLLEQLREFPKDALTRTKQAIDDAGAGLAQKLHLTLTLELSNQEAFSQAMDEARRQYFQ